MAGISSSMEQLKKYEASQQSRGSTQNVYLHYQADRPIKYDISFRGFLTTAIFEKAILVPVRTGPGRKLTSEGVVKVSANQQIPQNCHFQECVLKWTLIDQATFEKYKDASATKVYYRGFPLEATQDEVAATFIKFGPLQYVYIMCDSAQKKRTNRQGYIIYESRDSIERLFAIKKPLTFKGCRIHFEEYKSKNSILQREDPKVYHQQENHVPTFRANCTRNTGRVNKSAVYDLAQRHSHLSLLTRDGSNPESRKAIQTAKDSRQALSSKADLVTKKKGLRPYLRFADSIDINSEKDRNIRFNKPATSIAAQLVPGVQSYAY